MALEQIIQTVKLKQPLIDSKIIEQTYAFLKEESNNLAFLDRKSLLNSAEDSAQMAANENACPEFICASLLFDLAKRNKDLIKNIRKRLKEEIALIVQGYNYTKQAFDDSNPELLSHSYRTALRLASVKIDTAAICAALLHEIPAHTKTTAAELETVFGHEIAKLINNFQKIRAIKTSNNQQYIFHLREMVVAMAEDLRVIIIKMCSNIDRLKNKTIASEEKIKNVAIESREILAPIADILGIWQLRWQLEDLSFQILEPAAFDDIARRFNIDEKKNRDKYIQKTKTLVAKEAKEAGIDCQIEGRFKHFYSIHQKMKAKKKSFDEICDVFALRVIVNSVDDGYRMLGVIHRLWRPKLRRIKDYIAAPKSNKYRSLHTTVFGINGRATEFQIRTREMNEEANFGIAAHWYYKNPRKKVPVWIQGLLLKQQQYKNDEEFLTKFNSDILQDRIYVYSPKGDVISLPVGSIPLDFAYHVHTEIGNKFKEAVVNDIPVPINYKLATNDIVTIILDRNQTGPKADWLKFVKTNTAKKHIEDFLNRQTVERSFRL